MRRLVWLVTLVAIVALGCKGASAPAAPALDLDSDPLALLPGSAVVVANLDARALFASETLGPQIAGLADALVPFGADAGFDAKRDVDRVVLGVYTSTGADVAAILGGRFDAAKIAAAPTSRGGASITRGTYAGRPTYAVGTAMLSVLTSRTVVAGTGDGVRRVLERVQDGKLGRAVPGWMLDTLGTSGARIALAADLATQPVAAAAFGSVPLPWLDGMRVARIIGNFDKPGMNVAATLSYGNAAQASSAADGVRTVDGWLRVLGPLLGGVALQNLDVMTDGTDMKCKFAVDDPTLGHLLAFVPRLLGGGAPR